MLSPLNYAELMQLKSINSNCIFFLHFSLTQVLTFSLFTLLLRFIVLLSTHPYFKIHALGASSRSAGQSYKDAVRWKQSTPIPKDVSGVMVKACIAEEFKDCEIVFSGLDSDVAGQIG